MVIFTIGEFSSTFIHREAHANTTQAPTASTPSSSAGAAPSAARPRRRRPLRLAWSRQS
jgi:hypothetical protein